MYRLEEVRKGTTCHVTWMLGELASRIRAFAKIEPGSMLRVVQSLGGGWMVVAHEGKRYALSPEASHVIWVSTN